MNVKLNFPIKIDLCLHQSGPVTAPPSHATLNSGPKPPIFPKLIYIPRRDNRGEEREREKAPTTLIKRATTSKAKLLEKEK